MDNRTAVIEPAHPERQRRRIYGRRVGVKLKPGRKQALEELLPRRQFDLPAAGELEPSALFDGPLDEIWLEIGFGGGEHLAAQAVAHPRVGFIGVEPFINGVAKLMAACLTQELPHVRVLVDDARLLLAALPEASIDRLFVLFPDPWPKLRHHKRRIVNAETAAAFARVLKPGAELRLATDHADYGHAMLETMLADPHFEWLADQADDWRLPWEGWPGTRYEGKARTAGRRPIFLRFQRRP